MQSIESQSLRNGVPRSTPTQQPLSTPTNDTPAPPFLDGVNMPLDLFEDFTTFVDYAGLDPSWDAMDIQTTWNHSITPSAVGSEGHVTRANLQTPHAVQTEDVADDEDRLAGLDLYHGTSGSNQPVFARASAFVWRTSEADREALLYKLAFASTPPCPIIRLPSRHALTRYFQSYADTFQKHFPMLHLPTYSMKDAPPELSLAIAAIGAQYRLEFSNGLELYGKARHMTMERLAKCQNYTIIPDSAEAIAESQCGNSHNLCTIVLLMAFASWMHESELLSEALQMQPLLAHALRQSGLHDTNEDSNIVDWKEWAEAESRRRVKLVGFAYLNIQTVIYNSPPLLFANEIDILLPCASTEWEAKTSSDWRSLASNRTLAVSFQQGLSYLLSGTEDRVTLAGHLQTSPLALFVLLQALLQNIFLSRQISPSSNAALRTCDLDLLEYV